MLLSFCIALRLPLSKDQRNVEPGIGGERRYAGGEEYGEVKSSEEDVKQIRKGQMVMPVCSIVMRECMHLY